MSWTEWWNREHTEGFTINNLLKQLRTSWHQDLAQALEEAHKNALLALARGMTPVVQGSTDTTTWNWWEEIPKEGLNNLEYRKKVFDLLCDAILLEPWSWIEFFVHWWAKPVKLTGISDFLVFSWSINPESYDVVDGNEWSNFFKNRKAGARFYNDAYKWWGLDRHTRDYWELKNWFWVVSWYTDMNWNEANDSNNVENIALWYAFDIWWVSNEKYRKYQDYRWWMLLYGVRVQKSLMNQNRPYEWNWKHQQDVLVAIQRWFYWLWHEFCLYLLQRINPEFIDFMSLSLRMGNLREIFPTLKI